MSERPLRKRKTPKRFEELELNKKSSKRKVTEWDIVHNHNKKADDIQADQSKQINETNCTNNLGDTVEKSPDDESATEAVSKTPGTKMLPCSQCEARFSTGGELRVHSWKKHRLKCKICGMLFVREAALKLHMGDHEEIDPYEVEVNGHKRYKCDMCSVHCGRKRELLKHMQKQHEIGKPSTALMKNKQNGDDPGACDSPNETNPNPDGTTANPNGTAANPDGMGANPDGTTANPNGTAASSTGENMKCMDCLAVFNTSIGPKIHVCSALNKIHTCDNCNKVYSSLGALTFHQASHLDKNPFVVENDGSPTLYQCDRCPKRYKNDHSLVTHLNQHNNGDKYKCSHCEKFCKTRQGLEYHIRREHSGEKPHKCKHCHLCFISYSSLQNHMDNQHTDPKDFKHKCEICTSVFPRAYKLKTHINECHNDEKPFSCPQCSKQFARQVGVKLCMDSHNRPYVCSECQSSFTQKCHLKEHINSKHSSERRYACETCMKCFPTMKSVKQHITDCHSDKRYICEICHQDYKYRSSFHRHMKTHKNTDLTKDIDGEQNYMIMCQICEKVFEDYTTYDEHFEKTHKMNQSNQQDNVSSLKDKVMIIEDSNSIVAIDDIQESAIIDGGTIECDTIENSEDACINIETEQIVQENIHVLNDSGNNVIQLDFKPGHVNIDRLVKINDTEYQVEIVKDPSAPNVDESSEGNDTVLHVEISENGSMVISGNNTSEREILT